MEPSFDQSTFSKNRGRLLKHVVAQQFFDEVVRQANALGLLSDEHFSVDSTLIECRQPEELPSEGHAFGSAIT